MLPGWFYWGFCQSVLKNEPRRQHLQKRRTPDLSQCGRIEVQLGLLVGNCHSDFEKRTVPLHHSQLAAEVRPPIVRNIISPLPMRAIVPTSTPHLSLHAPAMTIIPWGLQECCHQHSLHSALRWTPHKQVLFELLCITPERGRAGTRPRCTSY